MKQVNVKSGFKRPIRRLEGSGSGSSSVMGAIISPISVNVPTTWTKVRRGLSGYQNTELVPLSNDSKEWNMVDKKLKDSIPFAKLEEVLRVESYHLWEYFCFRVNQISKLNNGKDPNIVRVWHGSRNTNPKVICEDTTDGFMIQRSSNDGGSWGQGIYFASKAEYSDNYAYIHKERATNKEGNVNHPRLKKSMILSKLVVGDEIYMRPNYSLRHCPAKPMTQQQQRP